MRLKRNAWAWMAGGLGLILFGTLAARNSSLQLPQTPVALKSQRTELTDSGPRIQKRRLTKISRHESVSKPVARLSLRPGISKATANSTRFSLLLAPEKPSLDFWIRNKLTTQFQTAYAPVARNELDRPMQVSNITAGADYFLFGSVAFAPSLTYSASAATSFPTNPRASGSDVAIMGAVSIYL